jgi:hypothetical protein
VVRVTGLKERRIGTQSTRLPVVGLATSDDYANVDESLFLVERSISGEGIGGIGVLVELRMFGIFGPIEITAGGVPPNGTVVCVADSGFFVDGAASPTAFRQVGSVIDAEDLGGGQVALTIYFDGGMSPSQSAVTLVDLFDLGSEPNPSGPDQARLCFVGGVLLVSIDEGNYRKLEPQRGSATLAAGTVTVSGVTLTAYSRIVYARNDPSGALGELSCPLATRNVGAGTFVLASANVGDTSGIDWAIYD